MSGTRMGYVCLCGTYHKFGFYVAAHWYAVLNHACIECGAVHSVFRGRAQLLKKPIKEAHAENLS